MQHVADGHYPSAYQIVEPHQNAGQQKEYGADNNGPEIQFLASVEESGSLRRHSLFVSNVSIDFAHPLPVFSGPMHWPKPVQELKEKEDIEKQNEPRMKKARHGSTTKERCQ